MSLPQLPLEWMARESPLRPDAVHAAGAVARALAMRLLSAGDTTAALSGVSSATDLVLLGPEEALPWVDGVTYLGRSEAARSLYLPTTLRPTLPEALVERALLQRLGSPPPLAVLPARGMVFPLANARPVSLDALRRWLEAGATR